MKTIIAKALFNSHSYLEYRKLVSDLLTEQKSTGLEQTEALTQYSKLNDTRMSRLDKTIKIIPECSVHLETLKKEYIWVVLSEGWCGDAAQIVPILHKMALVSNGKIDLKIVLRDENDALMNLFLTNNTRSIPKLIIIDKETTSVLGDWGPRPEGALDLIKEYKKKYGEINEEAKTELQLWYLHDKGVSVQKEITAMMASFDHL
ncbi:thioredoxin family protein [Flavobacterium sp. NG2]|uniref:thioredoxin family protein n=1 Tax=Flavobacterium sp. NG2 TaxID=3097547 RepID=UPI002A8410FB|nr:thioredoxin family protein [Flavobacterium sp. NG2]WPR72455.1 thioredoxin family protein [Flavobacterium sp. NG2]